MNLAYLSIIISTLCLPMVLVTAKNYAGSSGGGSSLSSGGGGGNSYSQPGPSPTTSSAYTPSSSSSTTNKSPTVPSSSSTTNNQAPSASSSSSSSGDGQYGPTYASSNTVSSNNPNPAYKPQTPAGAPTMAGGGGGYSSQPRSSSSSSGGSLLGAAAGGYLLGSFLYGGMYSSPSCRGGYDYNGNCQYGTSSANHQCPQQIPLCPIPPTIRDSWYIGATINIEVLADQSTCSSSAPNFGPDTTPATTTTTTTTTVLPTSTPVVAVNDTNGTTTALSAAEIVPNNNNNNNTNNNTFTLADCTDAIVTSTTCSSSKRFTYDEVSGKCKCCDVGADLIPWDYTSAVYVYSSSNPLELYGAPQYCISGSTMYYPQKMSSTTTTTTTTTTSNATAAAVVSGGNDDELYTEAQYSCTCGDCTECGDPTVSYVDWNGPFVVPKELGTSLTAGVSTVSDKPLYDPVDTCTCNIDGPQCAAQYQEEQEPPPPPTSGGSVSVYTTAVSTTTVGLLLMMMMMMSTS